jgi:Holliday junction DNA helicase RuvA
LIGLLRGKIERVSEDQIIIMVGGVGYEILASQALLSQVHLNEELTIPIYTHVREDALQLFGFQSVSEKSMFLSLNQINGIGPKMALKILGAASLRDLTTLIEKGDVQALSKLPRVGKKTAEQMVLALKGKLDLSFVEPSDALLTPPMKDDLVSALTNLGFKRAEVEFAITEVDETLSLQDAIKESLRVLSAKSN